MEKSCNTIDNINNVMESIIKEFEECRNLISRYDMAEQDIIHHIEFDFISDDECVSIVKLLKSFRQSRRSIKNRFEALNLLKATLIDECKWTKLKQKVERVLSSQEDRTYNYRVLKFIKKEDGEDLSLKGNDTVKCAS